MMQINSNFESKTNEITLMKTHVDCPHLKLFA
jgi:hypothetical protein